MKRNIVLLSSLFLLTNAVFAAPGNGNGPQWSIAVNGCLSKDTTMQEVRDFCKDFLSAYDPDTVTATLCPNSDPKGKKNLFTPNGFCGFVDCQEDEIEINCAAKYKNVPNP